MKKFNKNSIVFVFAFLFIFLGFGSDFFNALTGKTIYMLYGLKNGNIYSILNYKFDIDDISDKKLSYHDAMVDLNSIRENLLGTRIIIKGDITVAKADSGSLTTPEKKLDQNGIIQAAEEVLRLKTVSKKNGADFMYCMAPVKEMYESLPSNVENNSVENYEYFMSSMDKLSIPYIDFSKSLKDEGISDSDLFYYTDHHWKSYSGFVASKSLVEELNLRYGMEYNKEYTDINNYNIKTYPKMFLGSYGKKTGRFFTWRDADDFDLITPKFETSMTEEQPFKERKMTRKGKFEDTALFTENIIRKDYYGLNTYAVYSGGDFRLQIIKNKLNKNGKKVLLIRDSFACVVAPFLALHTSELHICDMRKAGHYRGPKLNMENYIDVIKPDYVIVLYGGAHHMDKEDGRFNFF